MEVSKITACLESFPITTLTGPRQSGKTTLATQIYRRTGGTYLDTDRRSDRLRLSNPKSFLASREGFALEQLICRFGERYCYFWRTAHGTELDLLVLKKKKKFGFEIKMSEAPGITRSMCIGMENLELEHLWIVAPVRESYSVEEGITVNTLHDALNVLSELTNSSISSCPAPFN